MKKGDTVQDPAYPLIGAILRVVPASRWAFARIKPSGDVMAVLASHPDAQDRALLADELALQRQIVKRGSRIAAPLGTLRGCTSGITLIFADHRGDYGIATLLRDDDAGLFTSSEVGMLTFALESVSQRLAALRVLSDSGDAAERTAARPPEDASYILDHDFEIVLAWTSDAYHAVVSTGLKVGEARRLPVILEQSVRDLTSAWTEEAYQSPGVAHPVPFLVVRTQSMSGPLGRFIGVRIDRVHSRNLLAVAAARFSISPRELEVLAMLMDGQHLDEIGQLLHITSSTVQDHIKSMVVKTGSRNRSELIAHMLGWEYAPASPGSERSL